MIYRFKTPDCPDANGRQPKAGDVRFVIDFKTDDGGHIFIEMGRKGREAILDCLAQEAADYPEEK